MGLHQRKSHKRVKPPQKGLIQWLLSKVGRAIYQAADGFWYLACSIFGRKLRDVQPGRGYHFTGVETITFTQAITTIIDQDGADLSSYLSGQVLTPPSGDLFKIVVNGIDYDLEESAGLKSYRSIAGEIATITLNGSSESSFHITSNQVPSVQNELGYNVKGTDPTNVNAYIPIDQNGNGKIDVLGNTVTYHYHGKVRYDARINGSPVGNFNGVLRARMPMSASFRYTYPIYYLDILVPSFSGTKQVFSINGNACYLETLSNGQFRLAYNRVGDAGVQYFYSDVLLDYTGQRIRLIYARRSSPTGWDLYLNGELINSSGTGFEIDYETDSYLYFSYRAGYTGAIFTLFNFISCENTGTNLADLLAGKFPQTSHEANFIFMEEADLASYNIAANRPAGSDLEWVLNGSAAGAQWGVSDLQTPWIMIEGYWIATPDLGVKYPYNVGGDKTFVPPGRKTENTFNRNPFDAPALVAAGIPDTEDISYEDITDDESRFYDNAETDRIVSMLAYSDFPEPIAGSVFQGDNNISLTHPDLSGITIVSWVGTATPTKSGDDILVTSGTLLELILSDGSRYIWSEETGLIGYDLLKQNDLTINLNGSTLGTQYTLLANKDYHHKFLWGYTVGGIFDGIIGGKFSEPNNTDSAWQIQGFKVELDIIIDEGIVWQALFDNTRVEVGEYSGFTIAHAVDEITIGIAHSGAGIGFSAISSIEVIPDTAYTIIVSKKPNSATINVSINGETASVTPPSATIYYSASGQSTAVASRYNHTIASYDKQTPCTVKRLRVTEIDDDEEEINELIDTDWKNGDGASVPNIADDAPSSSDLVFVDGTGSYTGLIPGDPSDFGFDIQGSKIHNLKEVKLYKTIKAFLRRNS